MRDDDAGVLRADRRGDRGGHRRPVRGAGVLAEQRQRFDDIESVGIAVRLQQQAGLTGHQPDDITRAS